MSGKKKILTLLLTTESAEHTTSLNTFQEFILFLVKYAFIINNTSPETKILKRQLPPHGELFSQNSNGARYLDPKYSRWISTDPALGEYVPAAGKGNASDAGNLPGMGGIYNSVNGKLYHYAGNNPVRYTDPDGRFEVESPYMKNKRDPTGNEGYTVKQSNWNFVETLWIRSIGNMISESAGTSSKSNASRDAGITYDKGYFTFTRRVFKQDGSYGYDKEMQGDFISVVSILGNFEKKGPAADQWTFKIYADLFGGEIKNGKLIAPKDQTYSQVRNRVGCIFGLVAWELSKSKRSGNFSLADGLNVSEEYYNLPQKERDLIVREIKHLQGVLIDEFDK